MSEPDKPSTPDRLIDLLEEANHEEAVAYLDRLGTADAETRKRALRAVRNVAEEPQCTFGDLTGPISTFLSDEARSVRLTTAKLFVTLAESEPDAVLPVVDALADRLAEEEEFYYVRARCAESLGYVALEYPTEATDPELLADLRIGLSFDEPEVREKLAKALAYVALGAPSRLRHQVSSLVDHLDDDNELVRYYLATALTAIGCEHPEQLGPAGDALVELVDDEEASVRGRVAEALGLIARSDAAESEIAGDVLATMDADDSFAAERVTFALDAYEPDASDTRPNREVGTVESLCESIDEGAEAIVSPDDPAECPHCGLSYPPDGPPVCPQCGTPR